MTRHGTRAAWLAFFFSLLAIPAVHAQTATTVNATVIDPHGIPYAGGSVYVQLVPQGVSNPTVNGLPFNSAQGPIAMDQNGHFSINLFCNTAGGGCSPISPPSTQWEFTISNPGVQPPLGFGSISFKADVTITGATQDISATLNALAPALSLVGSGGGGTVLPGTATDVTCYSTTGTVVSPCGSGLTWNNATQSLTVLGNGTTSSQHICGDVGCENAVLVDAAINQVTIASTAPGTPSVFIEASNGTPGAGSVDIINTPVIGIGTNVQAVVDLGDPTGGSVNLFEPATFQGSTSGAAALGVAAVAGTPNRLNLPTTTGSSGQCLATNGANPQQLSWDSCGSIAPGVLGEPAIYSATAASIKASNQTVDASAFAGTHWTDKVVAAYTALGGGGGTIIVPDSIADNGSATTPSIPSNVTLQFPGSAVFISCTINVGTYTKIISTGGAHLQLSGTNCVGLNQTNFASRQTNDYYYVKGLIIDGNSQTGAIAFHVGNHSQTVFEDTHAVNFNATGSTSYDLQQTQFGLFRRIAAYNGYACAKIYSLASGGGGNSNTFESPNCDTFVDGFIFANQSSGAFPQEGNRLINPQFLSATNAEIAVFGNGGGSVVSISGMQPEVTSAGTGTVVIDGNTIKQSSIYLNGATLNFYENENQEASIAQSLIAENGSVANLRNPTGFGTATGVYCQADATSSCSLSGIVGALGTFQNVSTWPDGVIANQAASTATKFYGSPLLAVSGNFSNAWAGNAMTPTFTDTAGSSSSGTVVDSQFGLVSFVTHAASAGNLNSNRFIFNPLFTTTQASDAEVSVLLNSSVACSYTVENYADNPTVTTVSLPANQWVRVVIVKGNMASSSNFLLDGFPNCSTGPTIKVTALQATVEPAGTLQSQIYLSEAISTGIVGNAESVAFSSSADFIKENVTAATSGANQSSPRLVLCGELWTGATARDCMGMQNLFGAGTNPTTTLKFTHPVAGGSGFNSINFADFTQVSMPTGFWSSSQVNTGSATTVFGGNVFGTFTSQFSAVVPSSTSGTNTAGTAETIGAGLGTGNSVPALLKFTGGEISTTSGTTVQSTANRQVNNDTKVSLTSGSAKTLLSLNVAADSGAATVLRYAVILHDTTGHHNCTLSGILIASAENSGGTIVANVDNAAGLGATSVCDGANTLTATFAITNANPAVLSVTPTWTGITPTASYVIYNYDDLSDASISP
jgi:hypothetical protein